VAASVGTRLNALDSQEGLNADFVIDMKTVLSATEDLDYAEAIGQFNLQTVSLQAAQQAFAQVKKLSLFNYL
jgi:flagellar hook-associated protein 3 FlgL